MRRLDILRSVVLGAILALGLAGCSGSVTVGTPSSTAVDDNASQGVPTLPPALVQARKDLAQLKDAYLKDLANYKQDLATFRRINRNYLASRGSFPAGSSEYQHQIDLYHASTDARRTTVTELRFLKSERAKITRLERRINSQMSQVPTAAP